uniref:Uncharacterized protein n=1 Tax=Magnetococcus massalia (strain MO-1) TaxID=451514 RepID=A0A1S7LCV4_MAGMO|nr:Protein of unknown function [Candidatus Magnetococcus massalia]
MQTQSTQTQWVQQELMPDQGNTLEDETYLQALHQELMLLVDSYQQNFAQLTQQSLQLNEGASLLQQRQVEIEQKEQAISELYQQLLENTQPQHDSALDMDQLKQHLSAKLDQFLDQIVQIHPLNSSESALSTADFEGFSKKLESVNQQKMVLLNLKERVQQQQERAQKIEQRLTTYEQLQIQKQMDLAQRTATLKAREKALQTLEKKSLQAQQDQQSMAQQQQQAIQQLHDQVSERASQLREKDLKLQEAELKLTEQRTRLSQQIDDLTHTTQQLDHQKIDLHSLEYQLKEKENELVTLKEQLQQLSQESPPPILRRGAKTIWTLAITVPLLIGAYYLYERALPSADQAPTVVQSAVKATTTPMANQPVTNSRATPPPTPPASQLENSDEKNSTPPDPDSVQGQRSVETPQPLTSPQPLKEMVKTAVTPAAEPSKTDQNVTLEGASSLAAEAPQKPQQELVKVTASTLPDPANESQGAEPSIAKVETATTAPVVEEAPTPGITTGSAATQEVKAAKAQPVTTQLASKEQTAASTTQEPPPPAPHEGEEKARTIQALLKAAQADIRRNRLSWPTHDNALIKIRKALAIQPNHAGALQGIQDVANRYAFLVNREIKGGDLGKARIFLSKAQSLAPESGRVKQAAQALALAKQ